MREQNRLKNHPVYKTLYVSWANMRRRCLTKTHPKYPRYGGRGIKIYEEWNSAEKFLAWALENGWKEGYTIDRIDTDGNYYPENCQWISKSDNSRKKSTTKISIIQATEIRKRLSNGENAHALAKEYGVVHGTIWFIENNFTHVSEGECTKKLKSRK